MEPKTRRVTIYFTDGTEKEFTLDHEWDLPAYSLYDSTDTMSFNSDEKRHVICLINVKYYTVEEDQRASPIVIVDGEVHYFYLDSDDSAK